VELASPFFTGYPQFRGGSATNQLPHVRSLAVTEKAENPLDSRLNYGGLRESTSRMTRYAEREEPRFVQFSCQMTGGGNLISKWVIQCRQIVNEQ
jgi:hypothetical protein